MKAPVFNIAYASDETRLPHNGKQLFLFYIQDIKKRDNMIIYSQMCDAGYRMGRDNEDYNYWNQCVFEDIDYKVYMENHKDYIDPNIIYEQLYDWIYNNYKDVLYYAEMSRSMKGYHIVFFFDVNRIKKNRMMCKALTTFIIRKAFDELGYGDIINFPKVFDDCTDSFYQACFFTLNNYKINKECTGKISEEMITNNYYSIKEIYDKMFGKQTKRKKTNNDQHEHPNEWDIQFNVNDIRYKGEYMNHHERWYLFKSLSGLFNNKEELEKEWEKCAAQLPEGNGHTKHFYMTEPKRNNWYQLVDKSEYVDTDLLKKFNYDIKFIKVNKDENNVTKKAKSVRKERVYIS